MSLLSLSLLLLLSSKSLQLLCNYLQFFFCFSGSSNLSSRSSGSLRPQHLRNSRGVLRIADDCALPIKLTVYLASNTRSLFEIVQSARWLPLSLLMLDEFFDFELYFFTFSFSALMIFWSADRAVSISDHSRVSWYTPVMCDWLCFSSFSRNTVESQVILMASLTATSEGWWLLLSRPCTLAFGQIFRFGSLPRVRACILGSFMNCLLCVNTSKD